MKLGKYGWSHRPERKLAMLQSLEVLFQCQINPNKSEQPE